MAETIVTLIEVSFTYIRETKLRLSKLRLCFVNNTYVCLYFYTGRNLEHVPITTLIHLDMFTPIVYIVLALFNCAMLYLHMF